MQKQLNVQIVILFGSAAIKEENSKSDIDILIVNDKKIENLNEITKKINSISPFPLNIFKSSIKDFKKNNDHLIINAKKFGFPIIGEQKFYEIRLNEFKQIF